MERLSIKKIILTVLAVAIFVPTFGSFAVQTFAQTNDLEYTVLAPLPGTLSNNCETEDEVDCKTTLEKYLPGMFKLAIGLAAAFAVLMIVIGGFQYMSTDALQKKEDGKNRIWNSIKGLVLVIGAWLILNTINPNLLTLNLNIESVNIKPAAGGSGSITPGGSGGPTTSDILDEQYEIDNNNQILGQLKAINITPNKGYCTAQSTSCTNLYRLPNSMVSVLGSLTTQCGGGGASGSSNCPLILTGGTETYAHVGHGPGKSVVDIGPTAKLNGFLGIPNPVNGSNTKIKLQGKDIQFTFEKAGAGRSTGDHWHVVDCSTQTCK